MPLAARLPGRPAALPGAGARVGAPRPRAGRLAAGSSWLERAFGGGARGAARGAPQGRDEQLLELRQQLQQQDQPQAPSSRGSGGAAGGSARPATAAAAGLIDPANPRYRAW
jgi:hypothetical protein